MSNTGKIADAELGARKPGWRKQRARVRLFLWLAIPPGAIAVAFLLQPAHVVLDIPVTPNATGYFWWEEQSSQLSYADSWGVLYVHRKVGSAYPTIQGWQTIEEAFAHFNGWLTANGWVHAGIGVDNPAAPESRLLKPEQVRSFHHASDRNIRATVMVWPTGASGFHVVVTTQRPSWARILQQGLD
jgi:hypothetical protein